MVNLGIKSTKMIKNILVTAALLTLTAFYNPASGQIWTQLGDNIDGEAGND